MNEFVNNLISVRCEGIISRSEVISMVYEEYYDKPLVLRQTIEFLESQSSDDLIDIATSLKILIKDNAEEL